MVVVVVVSAEWIDERTESGKKGSRVLVLLLLLKGLFLAFILLLFSGNVLGVFKASSRRNGACCSREESTRCGVLVGGSFSAMLVFRAIREFLGDRKMGSTYCLFTCLCLKPWSFWLAGLKMASEGET